VGVPLPEKTQRERGRSLKGREKIGISVSGIMDRLSYLGRGQGDKRAPGCRKKKNANSKEGHLAGFVWARCGSAETTKGGGPSAANQL